MDDYPYLSGVHYESIADGPGVRTAIFLSGCSHCCPGCHNPQTHDPCFGQPIADCIVDEIANHILGNPYITGITLTGGDPLYCPLKTANFLSTLKSRLGSRASSLSVWLYTGYTWQELMALSKEDEHVSRMLDMTDVVVDGRYVESCADARLAFRGSSNQRLLDVKRSMKFGIPILTNAA